MSYSYLAPRDGEELDEALRTAKGPMTVIGGGTVIIPRITFGQETPTTVLDLSKANLDGVGVEDGLTILGAMTTYRALNRFDGDPTVARLLHKVANVVTGGPQIRNRGTVGGSASYANPGSDIPGALTALDARCELRSPDGIRNVPISEFFVGPFTTCLHSNEALTSIAFPSPVAACGYYKFKLSQSSWPIVTAASILKADGKIQVAVGGLAGVPVLLQLDYPIGAADPEWRDHVRTLLQDPLDAAGGLWTDELAPGTYRARITPTIIARSIADCLSDQAIRPKEVQP